jgi:hypothetical protein
MAYASIPVLTDWQYEASTKKLKHNTGSTRVSVNTLYSAIMDLVDDDVFMDDTVPMKGVTPTEYQLINGWTFNSDDDLAYLTGGSVEVLATDDLWANYYNLGTLKAGTVLYVEQNGSLVTYTGWGYTSGDIDVLVKVRAAGSDVDSREVSIFARNLGDTYDVFTIAAPATGGRNPVPVSTATDSNDDSGTASNGGITITFGTVSKDIGDGLGAVNYDVLIDGNGLTSAQVYKALKYETRRQSTGDIDAGAGPAVIGRFYRLANATYTEVKNSPFGSYAGGTFFGARGVWLENISDPNSRELIDAAGVSHTPPVSITFTVTSVVSGDRVLVARSTGSGSVIVNKSQFTLNGIHSAATTIVVNEVVGADIPDTGVIRVDDVRYEYGAVNRGAKTFSSLSGTVTAAANTPTYVPLIDDTASGPSIVSSSMIYASDFDVVYRVRKKGIIPFENSAVVGSAGQSVSAIRTTDTIVT